MLLVDRAPENVSVAEIWQLSVQSEVTPEKVARVMDLRVLPDFWKERVGRRAMI